MSADLVLPNFISALESADPTISCGLIIEYLYVLVKAATNIKEREQYHAVI